MGSKNLTNPSIQKTFAFIVVAVLIVTMIMGPSMTSVKAVQAANAVITHWTFDSVPSDASTSTGTTNPMDGGGTLSFIGGSSTTGGFVAGQFYDSAFNTDDSSYEIKKFPSQGKGNLTTGLEFSTPTLGYSNVVLTFAHKHNNFAPNRLAIQYAIDGGNFITHTFVIADNSTSFVDRTINFGTALNNKSSVKFRIVATYADGTEGYAPTSGSNYNGLSANIKFDNVFVRADSQVAATNTPTRTPSPTPTNTLTPTPTNTATATPTARATTMAGGQCTDYTNNTAQAIPDTLFDEVSGLYTFGIAVSTITVPTNFQISDLDIINFNTAHQYMSDLKVELISPQGTVAMLFSTIGYARTEGLVGTTFDDQAGTPITDGQAPYSGSFKPTGPLYVFNALNSAGQWRLRVTDKQKEHIGTLQSWTLRLCTSGTGTPTQTPTSTITPGGPTPIPGATNTPGGPTETATPGGTDATPTPTSEIPVNPDMGNIHISVDAQPDSGQNFDFAYQLGGFTLDNAIPDDGDAAGVAKTTVVAPGGPYQFMVNIPPEWTVTQITCTGGGLWETQVDARLVKITVDAGDLTLCNFVIAYTSPNTPTSTPNGPTHTPTNTPVNQGGTATSTPTVLGGVTPTPTSVGGGATSTPVGPVATPTQTVTPTSDPNKGRLDILVDAQPDSGQNFNFFSSFGDFTLDDQPVGDGDGFGNKKTFQLTAGGPYAFSASFPQEWQLQAINCSGTGRQKTDVAGKTLEVTLAKGNAMVCTFVVAYTSPNTPTSTPIPPTATPVGGGGTPTATPTATHDPRENGGGTVYLPIISR